MLSDTSLEEVQMDSHLRAVQTRNGVIVWPFLSRIFESPVWNHSTTVRADGLTSHLCRAWFGPSDV